MKGLVDTNVLLRVAEKKHRDHPIARGALRALARRGDEPILVPQVIYEFWVVCTRPAENNGLGLEAPEAAKHLARLRALFPVLLDTQPIFQLWERLVVGLGIRGKAAHDARLIAAMTAHGIEGILTFDHADFERYSDIQLLKPPALAKEG